MEILVNLDVMMAKRKISAGELAERVGITPANLSILKNNKAKAIRFSTLMALCHELSCQPGDLLEFVERKFDLLDKVREIKSSTGISATISMGIGKGDTDLNELYQYARLAADTALARGGDQVVIKSKYAFEFYGGHAKEVEKRLIKQ